MTKNISTLLILFLTLFSYGQNITLLKNTHPKAQELKHHLNSTKDSLILASENKILAVEIFNEDYEKIIKIEANNAQISLREMPVGKFVVETKLTDKIILMDIIKYDDFNDISNTEADNTVEGKGMMLDEKLNIIKSSPKNSIEFILTRVKGKKQKTLDKKLFWTVNHIINERGSSKTMKLVDQESVNRMILQHKVQRNCDSGKLNELTIWEVYDTSKFMENQVVDPDFVYTNSTDSFNTTPYFATSTELQNL